MKIVFRVDASLKIGTGHVMRCLVLAKALKEKGNHCFFISRELKGNLISYVIENNFDVETLPAHGNVRQEINQGSPNYADWLETDWLTDAEQTLSVLNKQTIDWLVVDHYALDHKWETLMRPRVTAIMAIDDLADRKHACDLLLDQNLINPCDSRYDKLIPESCICLFGPKFALLQSDYAKYHSISPIKTGPIRNIFVYFGGSDNHNLTGLTISAFSALERRDLTLTVVMSRESPHFAAVLDQTAGRPNIIVHERIPTLVPLMLEADLAIGAAGVTAWERCCLGLPALVITAADNQISIAKTLDELNIVQWIGHHDNVPPSSLTKAITLVLRERTYQEWLAHLPKIVDGLGSERVASFFRRDQNFRL